MFNDSNSKTLLSIICSFINNLDCSVSLETEHKHIPAAGVTCVGAPTATLAPSSTIKRHIPTTSTTAPCVSRHFLMLSLYRYTPR